MLSYHGHLHFTPGSTKAHRQHVAVQVLRGPQGGVEGTGGRSSSFSLVLVGGRQEVKASWTACRAAASQSGGRGAPHPRAM